MKTGRNYTSKALYVKREGGVMGKTRFYTCTFVCLIEIKVNIVNASK